MNQIDLANYSQIVTDVIAVLEASSLAKQVLAGKKAVAKAAFSIRSRKNRN
jgi:hypothetical protein